MPIVDYAAQVRRAEKAEADAAMWRARCPVVASDVGPEHTAARVLGFALANGWAVDPCKDDPGWVACARGSQHMFISDQNVDGTTSVSIFCQLHAQASGMAPHDVLDAIGAMP